MNIYLKFQLFHNVSLFIYLQQSKRKETDQKKVLIYMHQYIKGKTQIQLTLSLFRSILRCIWSSAGHLEVASGQEGNTCVLVCARRRPDTNMSCLTHQPEPPRLSGTNAAYVPLSTRCSTPPPHPGLPTTTTTTHPPPLSFCHRGIITMDHTGAAAQA